MELGKSNQNCIVRKNLEKRAGRLGQEAKADLEEESEGSASEFLQGVKVRVRTCSNSKGYGRRIELRNP